MCPGSMRKGKENKKSKTLGEIWRDDFIIDFLKEKSGTPSSNHTKFQLNTDEKAVSDSDQMMSGRANQPASLFSSASHPISNAARSIYSLTSC